MSRGTPSPDSVTSELARLRALERTAQEAHDVQAFVHSRLRWCELIITLCPGLSAAAPTLARRIAAVLPEPPQPVPRWRLELRARPLVPIVRRTLHTSTLPSGSSSQTAVEYLACGHTHRVLVVLPGDLRARHRRCRQCGAARLAAPARRELRQVAVTSSHSKAKPARKGGRGESPEPAQGAASRQPLACPAVSV